MANDLDHLDGAEGGPQPAEGRELVIVDLGTNPAANPAWAVLYGILTAPPGDGAAGIGLG
jgi:hypothetical protein